MKKAALALMATALGPAALHAADWPQWGGADSRNIAPSETGIQSPEPIHSPVVAANGVLYVTTAQHLFAFKEAALR